MERKIFVYALMLLAILAPVSALQVELLSTDPAFPTAGDYADITLRLEAANSEPVRENVQLSVEDNRFVTPITSPKRINSLRPGDIVTGTFRVYLEEDTPGGDLQLNSLVIFDGQTIRTEHDLSVQDADRDAELRIGDIDTTPDQLLPDTHDNTITLTLQNLGEKTAELVTAELILQGDTAKPSSAFSTTDSIASIDGGMQAELAFTIDIEEDAQTSVPSQLKLTYRERRDVGGGYDIKEKRISLDIPVDDSPFLTIVAQEALTDLQTGTADNVLRVTIANTGTEEAEDVRVRLYPDISYPFIFERTSQYIGAKIQPGQNASIDITFEISKDAQVRDYDIAIELESLVETTRYDREETITVSVTEGRTSSVRTIAIIIIVIILLAAGGLAWWKRNSRS